MQRYIIEILIKGFVNLTCDISGNPCKCDESEKARESTTFGLWRGKRDSKTWGLTMTLARIAAGSTLGDAGIPARSAMIGPRSRPERC